MTAGTPVKMPEREMYKTEVKPCRTIKASPEEIAAELKKLGLEENRMMQNMLIKEDLERYLDEGLSVDEIANATGLAVSTIIGKAKRYGLAGSLALNDKPKQEGAVPAVVENAAEKDKNRTHSITDRYTKKFTNPVI